MRQLLHLTTVFLIILAGLSPARALELAGSDLLGEPVRDALRTEMEKAGLETSLVFEGSLLGLEALQSGEADACLVAIPDGRGEPLNLRSFPVAFQIVTFLVNSACPATEISFDQLANLYRINGTVDGWSSLTSDPDWSSRKVSLWAARGGNSVALEIFNAMVLGGNALKPTVRYNSGDTRDLVTILQDDASAMVVAPATFGDLPSVRTLAVKSGTSRQAYTPSPDNVLFGDYPLRLPFNLLVSQDLNEGDLVKLVRAVYSEPVMEAFRKTNWMPIPDTERRTILAQYD